MDTKCSVLFLGIFILMYVISTETANRPLQIGDTFTVQEMIPLAVKLLSKIKNPGNGKGIVSSRSEPYNLSKELFKEFFHSTGQSVKVEDVDIAGLNALQALALSGVHTGINPGVILPERDENNELTMKIKTHCLYLLLNKTAKSDDEVPEIVMPSYLPTYEPTCHYWVYACEQPGYIESCALYASCDLFDIETGIHEEHNNEYRKVLQDFRRNYGVTLLDEEVQKILKIQDVKRKKKFMDMLDVNNTAKYEYRI